MALTRQAKVVKKTQLARLLHRVERSRHPERDRVMVLLSFKAGLRAKQIADLTWSMVTDARGEIADAISLPKGKNGGRTIPLHTELREALVALNAARGDKVRADHPIIYSQQARGYSASAVAVWFHTRFREIGIKGASSRSGIRTFITSQAKKIVEAGGSQRDVQ
jgi:integrase/recombinase XerD